MIPVTYLLIGVCIILSWGHFIWRMIRHVQWIRTLPEYQPEYRK